MRSTDWDEYPNGRWGDSRSPAYGEPYLTGLYCIYVCVSMGSPTSQACIVRVCVCVYGESYLTGLYCIYICVWCIYIYYIIREPSPHRPIRMYVSIYTSLLYDYVSTFNKPNIHMCECTKSQTFNVFIYIHIYTSIPLCLRHLHVFGNFSIGSLDILHVIYIICVCVYI